MLLGNLGQDPELRYTQGGSAVLNMRLATTETYFDRDRNKKERTDWHNVVVWGKRAEALSKILGKGSSIFVEGSIRTSSFEGRDGQKRYRTEISARNIVLTGSGRRRESGGDMAEPDYPEAFGAGGGGASGGGAGGGGGGGAGSGGFSPSPAGGGAGGGGGGDAFGPDDDDIPF